MIGLLHHLLRGAFGFYVSAATSILVGGPLFVLAAYLWPADRGQKLWHPDFRTNAAFVLVYPFLLQASGLVAFGVMGLVLWGRGLSPTVEHALSILPSSPLRRLPRVAQWIIAFVLSDFAQYWSHRLDHTRWLWRFHSVHHSPRTLDWLSGMRQHPIAMAFESLFEPLLMFGVDPDLAFIAPWLGRLSNFLIHANVRWRFGPLRYVFVSPAMHRWHHADDPAVYGKNLGMVFAFWDVLFGTYYDPPTDRMPAKLGVTGAPTRVFSLLIYPFRRAAGGLPAPTPDAPTTTPIAATEPPSP